MGKRTVSVRIEAEADRLARVAASYAGLSKAAWISRAIAEVARREIAAGIATMEAPPTAKAKPKRPRR